MSSKRSRSFSTLLLPICLSGCSGQVVAVKLPKQDPNPNAYYVCTPSAGGASFDCKSERAFHQYDRELLAGKECEYGVANVYVETDWRGNVTRIQYVCGTAPVGGFPSDEPAAIPPAAPIAEKP
jgi:hypothetical protein